MRGQRVDHEGVADDRKCPECGTDMEAGFIEGTYLAWTTTQGGARKFARVTSAGMFASTKLGNGLWPSDLVAFRCPECGTGCW
jgi:predicted RNA-binding Zn-ribbon protein involved in translation (DUF1610 family)